MVSEDANGVCVYRVINANTNEYTLYKGETEEV